MIWAEQLQLSPVVGNFSCLTQAEKQDIHNCKINLSNAQDLLKIEEAKEATIIKVTHQSLGNYLIAGVIAFLVGFELGRR